MRRRKGEAGSAKTAWVGAKWLRPGMAGPGTDTLKPGRQGQGIQAVSGLGRVRARARAPGPRPGSARASTE